MTKKQLRFVLEKIFLFYKEKWTLQTTLHFNNCNVSTQLNNHLRLPDNEIVIDIVSTRMLQKYCNQMKFAGGYITSDFTEAFCMGLLHEIKHAIDYTYKESHFIRFLNMTEKEWHIHYELKYPNIYFERKADEFAIKEWKKIKESVTKCVKINYGEIFYSS